MLSRTRRATAVVALLLAVAGALSGCGLLPHHAPVVDDPRSSTGELPAQRFGEDSRPGLGRYYEQTARWFSCAAHTQCTDITAPMDWWHDRHGSIHLFLARHRATGDRRGILVVDPGGPGVSGANAVAGGVTSLVSADVARHYDVVGLDPRGVGYSSAIRCGGRRALDALFYAPVPGRIGSSAWIDAVRAQSTTFAEGCRSRSGALVDHVDSISAARDLELVRRVLRAPRLDYLGYSYGTDLGQYYAGMYPDHVGRMVLDGVEDPWGSGGGGGGDDGQGGGFETALDQYLRQCLKGDRTAVGRGSCPFSGTLDDARAAVSAALDRGRTAPLATADGRKLTDRVLATGIEQALYDTSTWRSLTRAFTTLSQGDPRAAMRLADDYWGRGPKGYHDNANEAFLAIGCLDSGSAYDLRADARELRDLRRSDPVLGPYSAYADLSCAGWHEPRSPFPAPVSAHGAPPILVVGTTRDPATPYAQARSVAHRLANGRLVTHVGDGHTAYDTGSACIDRVVDGFLLRGTVPEEDPRCRS